MTTSIHNQMSQSITSNTKLRLTRRGRVVVSLCITALAITVLALGAMFGASQAQASDVTTDSAEFSYVVAQPGDSLWSIASQIAPAADPRDVIYDLQRLNQISGSDIHVGAELAIPLKYNSK